VFKTFEAIGFGWPASVCCRCLMRSKLTSREAFFVKEKQQLGDGNKIVIRRNVS
jgi:hypothetical protein